MRGLKTECSKLGHLLKDDIEVVIFNKPEFRAVADELEELINEFLKKKNI
jgi:hypothetical protein